MRQLKQLCSRNRRSAAATAEKRSVVKPHPGMNAREGRFLRSLVIAAGAALFIGMGTIAWAEETDEAPSGVLPEVTVRGDAPEETGYAAREAAAATKTDTPLLETPQSVTVVTRERIEETGAQGLQDALNYAAGVRSDAYGLDSRTDSVWVRGGYPDEYLDGLRQKLGGFYTSATRVDPYMLERIEVLRGPSAMLFGQGTTGGVINMISKRPLHEAQQEVGLQYGSFVRMQLQTDLTGPVLGSEKWLYRVVALGRRSDTQVDHVSDDRNLVAPSLTWRPSGDTSLTLQLLWQQDRSGSTLQFFPWEGVVLSNPNGRIPTDRFIGDPDLDRYDSDRLSAGWLFEHRFNEAWTVRQNLRVTRNEVKYNTLYSDSFSNIGDSFIDPDRRVINRFGYFEERQIQLLAADQHVQTHFVTGPVRHQALLGLDVVRHEDTSKVSFDFPQDRGGGVPPIDVFDPVYPDYTPPPLADSPETVLSQVGVYLQDQLKINDRWIVAAGVRFDRASNRIQGSPDEDDSAVTKRLGLIYLFAGGWAPFVSYSESFTPVAGTDFFGDRFEPLRGEQIEAGLKWQAPDRDLVFTAAAYVLKEKNRQVPDPNQPLNTVQTGDTENRGIELEWVGRVLPPLDIAAHYNYIDVDEQLEILPKHQAAAWGTYEFALGRVSGFEAGAGVRYFSSFKDGIAPTVPSVTLFDAMIGYESERWRVSLNAQNVADKIYASTCLARGDCFYGARRTLIGTATYRF